MNGENEYAEWFAGAMVWHNAVLKPLGPISILLMLYISFHGRVHARTKPGDLFFSRLAFSATVIIIGITAMAALRAIADGCYIIGMDKPAGLGNVAGMSVISMTFQEVVWVIPSLILGVLTWYNLKGPNHRGQRKFDPGRAEE